MCTFFFFSRLYFVMMLNLRTGLRNPKCLPRFGVLCEGHMLPTPGRAWLQGLQGDNRDKEAPASTPTFSGGSLVGTFDGGPSAGWGR